MKRLILLAALTTTSPALAGEPLADLRTRMALRHETPCGWEELFRHGTTDGDPCGKTRGTVLYANGPCPKLKARLQNLAWHGKTFRDDGTLVNRWVGFEAVKASVSHGISALDGQPCLVMEYAPDAPVFGGMRDELRRIGPCTWLGRGMDGTTGALKGYFLLQAN